jgi:large subunit ribosomal protein L5e
MGKRKTKRRSKSVLKATSYFKRFQVKFARRRIGKTDYYARQRLILQDKNKYNSPKYRFSVRFTNRDVICQVIYATIAGDVTICAAYSHELPKYGMKAGLTNYAAAYATGLLCARRLLTKYDLAETYEGNSENLGQEYHVEADGDKRPFKCYLDVGLVKTSTGAKVFAALKGAVDGGLDIPHNDKRYAGYDLQDKSLDSDTLERYIKGGVVAEYAEEMQEEEPEKFQEHFRKYLSEDFDPTELEDNMEGVLEAIREDPEHTKKERVKPKDAKSWKPVRLTYDERKAAVKLKLEAIVAGAEEEDDEDED